MDFQKKLIILLVILAVFQLLFLVNKESKKSSKQNGRYVSNAKKKTWKHADLLTGFGKVMRTLEDEKNNKDLLLRLGMDGVSLSKILIIFCFLI